MTKKAKIAIIIAVIVVLLGVIAFGAYYFVFREEECMEDIKNEIYEGDYKKIAFRDNEIIESEVMKVTIEETVNYEILTTYKSYVDILKYFNQKEEEYGKEFIGLEDRFEEDVFEKNNLLMIKCLNNNLNETQLSSLVSNGSSVDVKVYYKNNIFDVFPWVYGDVYFVPISNEIKDVNIKKYVPEIKRNRGNPQVDDKPIIYLYPTETTEVSVILPKKELITCSYPKYIDGWRVKAEPNGDLTDLTTNRELYALYYESENPEPFKVENDGFVVKGEDSASFLEEKLETLGLTTREAEEFIVYWLPKLESNNYNYIRFATMEEIERNMPLEIAPNPDKLIRVLMTYKGLDNPIEVEEQKLITPERKGFVAVEWGGTEI